MVPIKEYAMKSSGASSTTSGGEGNRTGRRIGRLDQSDRGLGGANDTGYPATNQE